jgi:hypothetical protein
LPAYPVLLDEEVEEADCPRCGFFGPRWASAFLEADQRAFLGAPEEVFLGTDIQLTSGDSR